MGHAAPAGLRGTGPVGRSGGDRARRLLGVAPPRLQQLDALRRARRAPPRVRGCRGLGRRRRRRLRPVPAFTVHRESNPGREPSLAVIARSGVGVPPSTCRTPLPHTPDRRARPGNLRSRDERYLVAKDLAGGHAHRTLFDSLDLTVAPGDVVGVVGANGAGKSTLLRLLAGDLDPLDGIGRTAPADAFVGWLPQEHERVAGETVAGYIARRTGAAAATRRWMRPPRPSAPARTPGAAARRLRPRARPLAGQRRRRPRRAHPAGARRPRPRRRTPRALMTSLSGGQAARVGLAALLLSRFDIVLLDEPTNDLDLDGLSGSRRSSAACAAGVVLVSHDREFLARMRHPRARARPRPEPIAVYGGGYDAYLEERAVARRHAREEYDEFADKKADLVGRARTQREWSPGRAQRHEEGPRQRQDPAQGGDGVEREAGAEGAPDGVAGSPGSTRSRSRARSGSCSSRSARRRAPAPSSRR